jgi:hypothetical protein
MKIGWEINPRVKLSTLKVLSINNKNRLDKYCIIKYCNSNKYTGRVKSVIPPFKKSYKNKINYVLPNPKNSTTSTQYFEATRLTKYRNSKYTKKEYDHLIGRVQFYCKEYIEHSKYKKHWHERFTKPSIRYYYKPKTYLPYVRCLSTVFYSTKQYLEHQRKEQKADDIYRLNEYYDYLRSTCRSEWDADIIISLKRNPLRDIEVLRNIDIRRLESTGTVLLRSFEDVITADFAYCLRHCYFDEVNAVYKYRNGTLNNEQEII